MHIKLKRFIFVLYKSKQVMKHYSTAQLLGKLATVQNGGYAIFTELELLAELANRK